MIVYAQVTIDNEKMHLYTWLCIANGKIFIFLHITCLAFLKTKPIYAINSCLSSYISTLCVSPILNFGDFVEPGCKVDLMVQWVQPACFYHKLPSPISITNVGHRLCLVYTKLEGFGPR